MAPQRSLYRNLLLYEYKLERDGQTAFENIYRAKQAQGLVSWRTALWFFVEFRTGNTNLKDQLRFGHPCEVDRKVIIEATKLNVFRLRAHTLNSVVNQLLLYKFGISYSSVKLSRRPIICVECSAWTSMHTARK
ncbi:hypothetical protein KIN20_012978 [Parelaphostrongylus tenuis]|uniref:Mos1 transposase HTH domain-containing protein n=1 Tax=Parelaphostrongylus tenuis TaxID=148309 RepID=A0AAD5MBE8_PARTN|nr:hypothetical protein KIN20_012978 [Parelaphostrongylus tenuis]